MKELEDAWLPKWVDDLAEEAQVKLRDGAEWTKIKASELAAQVQLRNGRELLIQRPRQPL